MHSDLTLPARPAAVRWARGHAVAALGAWERADLAETAELLVSELITNAIRAAGESNRVRLRLIYRGERLRITVWDGDDRPPAPAAAGPEAGGGRGLLLVDALSLCWGWKRAEPAGKAVWCVLDAAPPDQVTSSTAPRSRPRNRPRPRAAGP